MSRPCSYRGGAEQSKLRKKPGAYSGCRVAGMKGDRMRKDEFSDGRTPVSDNTAGGSEQKSSGAGKKAAAVLLVAAVIGGLYYASHTNLVSSSAIQSAAAQISAPGKVNPVSGNRIVAVTKPLYILKEDGFAYTNIQWAEAICPEFGDYIPDDIPLVEAMANNTVNISGNSVSIELAPLAGITPVVFSDIGNGNVTPADVPDEEIEVVYGYRDGITLHGTITSFGTTGELDPDTHIRYGLRSGLADRNVYTGNTVYYINGTIDRVTNNIRSGKGFTSGYKETVYHHDGMYVNLKKTHESMYTYPGITQEGKEGIYNSDEELTGYRDVEYQAYSRFQIVYFPYDDQFQAEILLLDHGMDYAEGSDGNGRHEEDSGESDHIYRIIMLSDYKMYRGTDEYYEYMGDTYVTVDR